MNHSSDERVGTSGPEPQNATARIIPFERPPTALQRAIQMRAPETLERERARQQSRPAPLRSVVICVLALVPVTAVILGADAFVRVFHRVTSMYLDDSTTPSESPDAGTAVVESTTPGVVMLQRIPEEMPGPEAERARQ